MEKQESDILEGQLEIQKYRCEVEELREIEVCCINHFDSLSLCISIILGRGNGLIFNGISEESLIWAANHCLFSIRLFLKGIFFSGIRGKRGKGWGLNEKIATLSNSLLYRTIITVNLSIFLECSFK